jgi:hypothetical protein
VSLIFIDCGFLRFRFLQGGELVDCAVNLLFREGEFAFAAECLRKQRLPIDGSIRIHGIDLRVIGYWFN